MLAILLLAAGRSSRMGDRDKLLEEVDGAPLLRTMAARALTTGAPVFVVLPADRPERQIALDGLAVTYIKAPDAHLGMAHSLATGIVALPKTATAAMVVPADMPDLTGADLKTMQSATSSKERRLIRATSASGKPGHPVIFPSRFFPDLAALTGDTGARSVLAANNDEISFVPLPDSHALTDLDTPQDWAEWRARQARKTSA